VDGGDTGREVMATEAGVVQYAQDNHDGWMVGVVIEHTLANGDKVTSGLLAPRLCGGVGRAVGQER